MYKPHYKFVVHPARFLESLSLPLLETEILFALSIMTEKYLIENLSHLNMICSYSKIEIVIFV
jgi:hypothetical protein